MEIEVECETVLEGRKSVQRAIDMIGGKNAIVKMKTKRRTLSQNSAGHLHFTKISEHSRDRGLTASSLFKNPGEIPLTPELVKGYFRELGKWMYKKGSTADLDKNEFSDVVNVFEKIVAKELDFIEPFPSLENMCNGE